MGAFMEEVSLHHAEVSKALGNGWRCMLRNVKTRYLAGLKDWISVMVVVVVGSKATSYGNMDMRRHIYLFGCLL